MSEITEEHKREWREARKQALEGIARLNALFTETKRPYRAHFELLSGRPLPLLPAPDDDEDDEDDEGDSPLGSERAENENGEM